MRMGKDNLFGNLRLTNTVEPIAAGPGSIKWIHVFYHIAFSRVGSLQNSEKVDICAEKD